MADEGPVRDFGVSFFIFFLGAPPGCEFSGGVWPRDVRSFARFFIRPGRLPGSVFLLYLVFGWRGQQGGATGFLRSPWLHRSPQATQKTRMPQSALARSTAVVSICARSVEIHPNCTVEVG